MTSPAPLSRLPRPEGGREYLKAYMRVQTLADRELMGILREAARDIDVQLRRMSGAGEVRLLMLMDVRREIRRAMAEIWGKMGGVVRRRREEAALAAIRLNSRADYQLFSKAGSRYADMSRTLQRSFELTAKSTLDTVVARVTQSQFPLSQRVYRSQAWVNNLLDRRVNSALARGLDAREFAREVRHLINPSTPGGVRYAAMRLSRTEINNAFHAVSVNNSLEKPWVVGMQWNLSGSHPKPDECDNLARRDRFDLGGGVFPAAEVPRKPHPQCFCFVTPVTEEEDLFIDKLLSGQYDSALG